MQFLEANNVGEFSLTEALGDDIPRYKVTFEDLLDCTGKNKAGYQKIRFCAEQAGRDPIQYFWVDTCCIDRSSNTELAGVINLMFCCCRDADKRYVYLSDISKSTPNNGNNSHQLSRNSAFRASIWFTLGWTLQELAV
ncbi:hypothetical protein N431DRAFT_496840 [Stipitochalara longipes BDJ]|nr:hypothetical protein N431DRAFT_496840 [Stipitochalara longipes BDJ]